jgi:hypothetical protein
VRLAKILPPNQKVRYIIDPSGTTWRKYRFRSRPVARSDAGKLFVLAAAVAARKLLHEMGRHEKVGPRRRLELRHILGQHERDAAAHAVVRLVTTTTADGSGGVGDDFGVHGG